MIVVDKRPSVAPLRGREGRSIGGEMSYCPTERCTGQSTAVAVLRGLLWGFPLNANVGQTQ